MSKKPKSMFGGRTRRSMEKSKNDFGYLKVPSDMEVFKAEGGTEVVFDILPYTVTDARHMDNKKYADDAVMGAPWWKRPLKVHKNVGPDEIKIICPTTFGKKCPICEYGTKRRKEGAEWDELKEIFPKDRSLFAIVPVDVEECEVTYEAGEVHLFDFTDFFFLNTLIEEVSRDVDFEEFPNPYAGFSLQVRFKAEKFGKADYASVSRIDIVEREEQYDDEFLEAVPALDDLVKLLTYKEIEALYFGQEDLADIEEDDEELEEEEEKPTRRRKAARKPKVVEEEEEDEEEEEKPVRKTTRRKKAAAKPAPEPEEEEDEEEVEEKPVRKKRTARKPAPAPEEEEEDEEEAPPAKKAPAKKRAAKKSPEPAEDENAERSAAKGKATRAATKDRCPFGLKFGVDTDSDDACDDCDLWDSCTDEKVKLNG